MRLHRHLFLLLLFFSLRTNAQTPVIDSLQKVIALDKKDSLHINALVSLSSEYLRSNINKAKECLYASIVLSRSLHLNNGLAASYAQMVPLQMNIGMPDSAAYYLSLLKPLAGMHPGTVIETNYNFSAGLFYKLQGNYKAALPYLNQALHIQTERLYNGILMSENDVKDMKTSIAGQTLNIGNNYLNMQDIKNALTWHLKALRLFEEINNKRGQSFCLQSVAQDLISFHRYSEALPFVQKAMVLKTELNDKRGIATALEAAAQIYLSLKNYDKALENLKRSTGLNHELKIIPEEAKSNYQTGEVYAAKKDIKMAVEYFTKSKILALEVKDSSLAANATAQIIGLQLAENRQNETEKKLFSSLQTSVEKGDRMTEANSYKFLSDFYANNKQFDKALTYSDKFHAASDSMENNDLQVQLKKMEQQYNLEKKEKEIALLKKDQDLRKAELKEQRAVKIGAFILSGLIILISLLVINRYRSIQKTKRLIEIEKLRNNIARDLHDDIGSALSSININSKMALNKLSERELLQSQLEKIKENSGRIMERMNDIVWAINPVNDALDKIILRMKEFANELCEQSNIQCRFDEDADISNIVLSLRQRSNIYLIFKEAVNNAVKYSGADLIQVIINKMTGKLQLKIEDNGKGFDMALMHSGNGLKNMQWRATEIKGHLQLTSVINEGTVIKLEIPLT